MKWGLLFWLTGLINGLEIDISKNHVCKGRMEFLIRREMAANSNSLKTDETKWLDPTLQQAPKFLAVFEKANSDFVMPHQFLAVVMLNEVGSAFTVNVDIGDKGAMSPGRDLVAGLFGFIHGEKSGATPLVISPSFSCALSLHNLRKGEDWRTVEYDAQKGIVLEISLQTRSRLEIFPFGCLFESFAIIDKADFTTPTVVAQFNATEVGVCAPRVLTSKDICRSPAIILNAGHHFLEISANTHSNFEMAIRLSDLCISSQFKIQRQVPTSFDANTSGDWRVAEISEANLKDANRFVLECLHHSALVWVKYQQSDRIGRRMRFPRDVQESKSENGRLCNVLVGSFYAIRPLESDCHGPKRLTLLERWPASSTLTNNDHHQFKRKIDL